MSELPTTERIGIPTNADVDYVLQVYKPEIGPDRQYVYVDSPTVPGLHCMAETAEKALACAPAQVARLREDNANCTFEPKTAVRQNELQGPMTMLDAPERYDSTQASIWAVGYNKGYHAAVKAQSSACQRCRERPRFVRFFADPHYPDVEMCFECAMKEITDRKAASVPVDAKP